MSIEQVITDAIRDAMHPDKIQEIITPQIEKMMTQALGELFGFRGQIHEAVTEAIKAQMHIDPKALNFSSYNAMIASAIKQYTEGKANEEIAKLVEKDVTGIFIDPPAEIKASALVESWMNEHEADPESDDWEPFYEIKRRSDTLTGESFTLRLNNPKFNEHIEAHVNKETIISVRVREWDGKFRETTRPSFSIGIFNLERDIFKMYAAKTRLIDDL